MKAKVGALHRLIAPEWSLNQIWRTVLLCVLATSFGSASAQTQVSRFAGPVFDVAFSPNNLVIASAGQTIARVIPGGVIDITGFDGVPKGNGIIAYTRRINDKEIDKTLTVPEAAVNAIAFSPDSALLAAACGDGEIRVYTVIFGILVSHWKAHDDGAFLVTFSSDGQKLVTTGADQTVKVWDYTTRKPVVTIPQKAGFAAFCFNDQGIVTTDSNSLALWSASTGESKYETELPGSSVTTTHLSRSRRHIATGHKDGRVKVWNVSDGKMKWDVAAHSSPVQAVSFYPSVKGLASISSEGELSYWTLPEQSASKQKRVSALCIAFSNDGKQLAVGTASGKTLSMDPKR